MSELSDANVLREAVEDYELISGALRRSADRLEALERRLELTATAEDGSTVRLEIGDCDGIGCRDETIRQQDKRIEALERERDEAVADLEAHSPGIEQWEQTMKELDTLRAENARLRETLRDTVPSVEIALEQAHPRQKDHFHKILVQIIAALEKP